MKILLLLLASFFALALPALADNNPGYMAAGSNFTCEVNLFKGCGNGSVCNREIYCWGNNDFGQLGTGNFVTERTPARITGIDGFFYLAAGKHHACARRAVQIQTSPTRFDTAYALYCWGRNDQGQLGDGTFIGKSAPKLIWQPTSLSDSVLDVAAGDNHTCMVKGSASGNNKLYCWGSNNHGQLGTGTRIGVNRPTEIASMGTLVSDLSAGGDTTCADRIASGIGTLHCWGKNDNGQLGDNTLIERVSPTPVVWPTNVIFSGNLSVGESHACAMTIRNLGAPDPEFATYCWGNNDSGQIGDNTFIQRRVPTKIVEPTDNSGPNPLFNAVAGGNHTCASKMMPSSAERSRTYCWGDNSFGQLGTGDIFDRKIPTFVKSYDRFFSSSIAAGTHHSCTLDRLINVPVKGNFTTVSYCWGSSADGQVGNGSFGQFTTPQPILSIVNH